MFHSLWLITENSSPPNQFFEPHNLLFALRNNKTRGMTVASLEGHARKVVARIPDNNVFD